jgi:hypothetical protein
MTRRSASTTASGSEGSPSGTCRRGGRRHSGCHGRSLPPLLCGGKGDGLQIGLDGTGQPRVVEQAAVPRPRPRSCSGAAVDGPTHPRDGRDGSARRAEASTSRPRCASGRSSWRRAKPGSKATPTTCSNVKTSSAPSSSAAIRPQPEMCHRSPKSLVVMTMSYSNPTAMKDRVAGLRLRPRHRKPSTVSSASSMPQISSGLA